MRQALLVTMLLGVLAVAAAVVVSATPLADYVDPVAVEQPKVDMRRAAEERSREIITALRQFAIGAARLKLSEPSNSSPPAFDVRQDALALVAGGAAHAADVRAKAASPSVAGGSFSLIGREPSTPLPETEALPPVASTSAGLVEATDAAAAYALAMQYRYGQGVARNYAIAARYFLAAAEQGNALAQLAIGELFHEGLGVTRDDVAAYVWLELAANGAADEPQRQLATEKRDVVASLLSPDELQAARAQVAAWKPKMSDTGTLAG